MEVRKYALWIALWLLSVNHFSLYAQSLRSCTENSNSWAVYVGAPKLSDHWSLHLEMQVRRSHLGLNNMQLLPRAGVNYHLNNMAFVTLGYAFVETYPYGEFAVKFAFPEHRVWEQLQLKNAVGHFDLTHRFRLEQRWVSLPQYLDSMGQHYKETYYHRIRLLHRFAIAIGNKVIEDNTFYFTAGDELFINFGKNVGFNILDQNRAFAGLGYKLSGQKGKVELAYMNQLLFKSDGLRVENNHTVQISYISAFDFYKKQEKKN